MAVVEVESSVEAMQTRFQSLDSHMSSAAQVSTRIGDRLQVCTFRIVFASCREFFLVIESRMLFRDQANIQAKSRPKPRCVLVAKALAQCVVPTYHLGSFGAMLPFISAVPFLLV